jgi:5-formyltetrahydrofolate cyclo-ligase
MTSIAATKRAARAEALARREAAHAAGAGASRCAAARVLREVAPLRGVSTVSAYLPIGSELDPRPLMAALRGLGFALAVPVIEAKGLPLRFRSWVPGVAVVRGPFGVEVPAEGDWVEPDLLVVPLLAFDGAGHRLGYGAGFYDRTLAGLRARRRVVALGFAYAAQQVDAVPRDATDARLDAVVTEDGTIRPV